jgi:hypothetical protein
MISSLQRALENVVYNYSKHNGGLTVINTFLHTMSLTGMAISVVVVVIVENRGA